MNINPKDYSYVLSDSFIANEPAVPRDSCNLMVLDRNSGQICHQKFFEIIDLLTSNDVLVLNQSKVFPARIFGTKKTGGLVEVLLYHQESSSVWQCISKPGLKIGTQVVFEQGLEGVVIDKNINGETKIKFNIDGHQFYEKLDQIGKIPIPPYIHPTQDQVKLREEYQTVYASTVGSAAAPTAGLHFTPELLQKIKDKGVQVESVTLHVGLGTFQNLREENIVNKKLHLEHYDIDRDTASRLSQAKLEKKRIIAVGTTTVRTLESAVCNGQIIPGTNGTEIFIFPPYQFQFVDGLITNFHLPESSLLMLVSSFVSFPNTKNHFNEFSSSVLGKAYQSAIDNKYRFFSFGDAMFIY